MSRGSHLDGFGLACKHSVPNGIWDSGRRLDLSSDLQLSYFSTCLDPLFSSLLFTLFFSFSFLILIAYSIFFLSLVFIAY
jgi:hypothetical protein